MKKEITVCISVAAVSLVAAAVCHCFLPGFGAAFKPLLWPLAALPFLVRARAAALTAFVVPLVSAAVNGMPAWSVALSLSACAAAFAAAVGCIRALRARAAVAR